MIPGRKFQKYGTENETAIEAGRAILERHLGLPRETNSIVLFAHGGGSSRRSPRNRFVAHIIAD